MKSQFAKIGVWGRMSDTSVAATALEIIARLRALGIEVLIPGQAALPDSVADVATQSADALPAEVDLIVTVGGDGTMLHAARRAALYGVPLIGVNLGRLGFLTDIPREGMLERLESVLAGQYRAEERLLLEASIVRANGSDTAVLALNDVVLQKGRSGRMQEFITYVDGDYVNKHEGDGLIVSTPTGSTAYALSCGGPIVAPDVDALMIVPICPHTLSDRPLVLKASSTVEIRVAGLHGSVAGVSCDGEETGEIREGECLKIRPSNKTVRLLHPVEHSYFQVLRSKLNWGRANRVGRSTTRS